MPLLRPHPVLARILAVLSCLFLIFVTVLPCFAVTNGGSPLYAPIVFEQFRTGAGFVNEDSWIFNTVSSSLSPQYDQAIYTVNPSISPYDSTDGYSFGNFEIFPGTTSIQLRGSDQIVNVSQLQSLEIYFGLDADMVGRVNYSFELCLVDFYAGYYSLSYETITGGLSGSDILDVGRRMASDIWTKTNDTYVFLRNIYITINYQDDTSDGVLIGMNMHFYQQPPQSVVTWFNYLRLSKETIVSVDPGADDFDPVAWIDGVLEGLFEFQLMPGVSVGSIFAIILGIGILRLFLAIVQKG